VLIEIYESFRKENGATADVDQVASVSVLPRAVEAEREPEPEPYLPPAAEATERPARASRRDGTWAAVTDDTTGDPADPAEDTSGGGSEPPSGRNG
jgi:hypothetical protein